MSSVSSTSIVWFRRDLRLDDHPALLAADTAADRVLPLFVLDPTLMATAGARRDRLLASLAALHESTDGALVIRTGDPTQVLPQVVAEAGAGSVHISAETTPYGRRRDESVARRLQDAGVPLVATGSPYAVTPGRVRKPSGASYQVFTPFFKAWRAAATRAPAPTADPRWSTGAASEPLPSPTWATPAGEQAARVRWEQFLDHDLETYAETRDRPDLDVTSRLSVSLKYGELHPRTLLAELSTRPPNTVARFVTELGWREFYADVLWHHPASAWQDWRPQLRRMRHDHDRALIDAWRSGRTGYPFVDAGMRQLRSEGWMHNRVRMVTASFLVKDLHAWWPVGARHFLAHLIDGDVASNNHGWQWVAGTGTDAAPYFRIFNPVTQGLRFDPAGDYVRRWVPELRHITGAAVHEPWRLAEGGEHGYPDRIVDHATERDEALHRLAELKESR
ncbi:cryptochrome/photolyase family protein [Nocardioides limicola]|uniref:cryptochrome/photolyase family protein n=1 Tax=Nocardioides limicola TaxID=2803368 RepID=UPI0027DCC4B3|nr:deoxyribodipyrimidine photo-lyase [Nocardioides sp. DJM-14]